MGLISLLVGGAMDAHKAIKQNQAKNDDTVQTVVVQNKYSINIPSFLSPTNKLSEDVSLQYWNRTLDVGFQVIDEPKSEVVNSIEEMRKKLPNFGKDKSLLDNMATLAISKFFDMDKIEIGDYIETKINGINAIMLNVFQKRTFLKDAVYGSLAFIEGKESLYQIIILSGGSSIKNLSDKLEQAIYSFVELGKADEQPSLISELIIPQEEIPEKQEIKTIHCPECQSINDEYTNFCTTCGAKMPIPNEINEILFDESPKEETIQKDTEHIDLQSETLFSESINEKIIIPEPKEDNNDQETEETIEQPETSFSEIANGADVTNQAETNDARFIVLDNKTVIDSQSEDGNRFNEFLQKNIDLVEKLKKLLNENANLNEQITQCKSTSDVDITEIIRLNTEIKSLNLQIETLKHTQTDNAKKEEQIRNLQKHNNELKTKIESLEKPTIRENLAWGLVVFVLIVCTVIGTKLYEKEERIENLQNNNRELTIKLSEQEKQIVNLHEQNNELKTETVALEQYNKEPETKIESTEKLTLESESISTYDRGVVINGTTWATRNVDTPGKFVENPEDTGKYYQWNSTKAWTGDELRYNGKIQGWDSEWNGNDAQVWETTNNVCPKGWRIPTKEEIESLLASESKMVNSPVKGCIFGSGDNTIFLPSAGFRINETGALKFADKNGYYWSVTSSDKNYAYSLQFSDSKITLSNSKRTGGRTIRCVKE